MARSLWLAALLVLSLLGTVTAATAKASVVPVFQ
jgi:hypothetical protein